MKCNEPDCRVSERVHPYSARHLPPLPEELDGPLRDVVVGVSGIPFAGYSQEAVVYTIRLLRSMPDLAADLGIGAS